VLPAESSTLAGATNTAQNIRTGRLKGFAKDEFESAVHQGEQGIRIYVRYVGPATAATQTAQAPREPAEESGEDTSGKAAMIRAWARSQGREVGSSGRLPDALVAEWEAAHRS